MKTLKMTGTVFLITIFLIAKQLVVVEATTQAALPDPQRRCSITIQKYEVENLSEYTTPGTGERQEELNLPGISNINFTITRVQDDTTNVTGAVPLQGKGQYSETITTNESGVAFLGELEQGIYLVHEEESTAVHTPVEDFLVNLPMTNPAGNGWMHDVYVYPKNKLVDQPTINMYVSERDNKSQSLTNGQTAKWIVSAEVPQDIAKAPVYQSVAVLHEYLIFDQESMNVYVENRDGKKNSLVIDKEYRIVQDKQELIIELTEDGKKVIASLLEETNRLQMFTEFDTSLLIPPETLPTRLNEELKCHAVLRYTSSLDRPIEAVHSSFPYVYSGGIQIQKTNKENEFLSGAVFRIYRTLEDAREGKDAIVDASTGLAWEARTNDDGKAFFYGLAYGNLGETPGQAKQTYYLVETQAPAGYHLLTAPVEVMVDYGSLETDNYTEVLNRTGFMLPLTGGVGIFVLLTTGAILIAAAVILFKKVNQDKNGFK